MFSFAGFETNCGGRAFPAGLPTQGPDPGRLAQYDLTATREYRKPEKPVGAGEIGRRRG